MNCLNCKNILLNITESELFSKAVYDYCENCGGLWLDHGELKKVADQTPGDVEICTRLAFEEAEKTHHSQHIKDPKHGRRNCLRCLNQPLTKMRFMGDSKIIIDYCQKCGGIWLDKGELDDINKYIEWFDRKAKPSRFGRFLKNMHSTYWHSIETSHHAE